MRPFLRTRPPARFRTRWRSIVLYATAIAGALVACRDDITQPGAGRSPLVPSAPSLVVGQSPVSFSVTLPEATDPYGASQTPSGTVVTYPQAMYVRIVASGFHRRTPINPSIGPADDWGPSGNAVVAWWNGWNNTKVITQGGYVDETATSYAQLSGDVYVVARSGYGARSIQGYCGVGSGYPSGICDHWSGHTTVTFTRLESDLALTPEFTSVLPGATPYIDYRSNPMTVEGQPMYYNPDSTHWVPDSPAGGGEATEVAVHVAGRGACQPQYDPACRRKIIGSGSFIMNAWVNGLRITKSVHISAPFLKLAASPVAVHVGDSVVFTPTWSDGAAVTSVAAWTWSPDVLPGHATPCATPLPCKAKIQESGTMRVSVVRGGVTRTASAHVVVYTTFRLDVDRNSAFVGDTVTFTPKYDNVPGPAAMWKWMPDDTASDHIACANDVQDCKKQLHGSGTMWAFTATSGGDSASKHVIALDSAGSGCLSTNRATPVRRDGPRRGFSAVLSSGGTCAPALGPDTALNVSCTFPGSSVRGSTMRCEARMQPAMPFVVRFQRSTRYHANKMSKSPPYSIDSSFSDAIEKPMHVAYSAGGVHVWEGPAVAALTEVAFFADIQRASGDTVVLGNTAALTPTGRTWTQWYWDDAASKLHDDSLRIATPTMTPPLAKNFTTTPSPTSALLGMFLPQPSLVGNPFGGTVVSIGPDSGVAFATIDAPAQLYEVFVHPALRQPLSLAASNGNYSTVLSWQQRQTGGAVSGTTAFYCDSTRLDSLFRAVKRHEGWTRVTNSHWGKGDSVFKSYPMHQVVERASFASGGFPDSQFNEFIFNFFYGLKSPYTDPNAVFDGPTEYATMSAVCTFRP